MKLFIYVTMLALVGTCSNKNFKAKIEDAKKSVKIEKSDILIKYINTIDSNQLKTHLYKYASDEFEGRATGSEGQRKAAEFIANYYKAKNISSPIKGSSYFQTVPASYLGSKYNKSENVLAYIEGAEKPEEVVIISSHLDHEGIDKNGKIYYGADDDGSGTVAMMEMAEAFKLATDEGYRPKRSILFLHVTAEEIGLQGSRYYTENPVFDLDKTVANLNIDMIGRVDDYHKFNKDYVYLIGSDRLSTQLHYLSEHVNTMYFNINLDYKYNRRNESNRYYYRSDHYNFAKNNIPVIFYFNGEHEDYHQITDTPDKIDYQLLQRRTKLIFATAWELANRDERIIVDKADN